MKRSEFITDELIDLNLRHLQYKYEKEKNRLSINDFIDFETDHLLSNVTIILSSKLSDLGYIHLHGEIITLDQSLFDLNKNGGWVKKLEIEKEKETIEAEKQKDISELELKKLIAETIKVEYDVEKQKSNRSMSIIALIISGFLLVLELIKGIIEICKS